MRLQDRIRAGFSAFNQAKPAIARPDYSVPQTLDNLKISALPPSLQQYAQFIVTPPPFHTYHTYYQVFNEVQTPIDKIAERVAALGGQLYDKDGVVDQDLTDKLYAEYNLEELTSELVRHRLIYGQVNPALFNEEDTTKQIQLIPSDQVTLWQTQGFKIERLTWRFEYTTLDIKDDFKVFRIPSINSKFFGKSPLTSFYDDLNQVSLDRDNFNQFLLNNSFFGVAIIPNEGLSKDELDALVETAKQLNDPRSRYKTGVYTGVKELKQIKQEIQARLSIEEKKYIAVKTANAFGYPYQLLKVSTGGLGQGEQKTVMQNYKEETIDPAQAMVGQFINNFVLQVVANKAEYAGLIWKPNEMVISTLDDMMKVANAGFASGLFSAYEAKTRFLGYTDDEVQYDDKFRKIGSNVVKEGELKEGDVQTDEAQDEVEENIKSVVSAEYIKSYIQNAKSLNGNDKQRIKKFLELVKKERDEGFSPTEVVVKNDRAKMLQDMVEQAYTEQINAFDFIINKKTVDADGSLTEEEIREELTPLASFLDVGLMTYYVNYLMTLGKIDAINQIEELGLSLTNAERAEVNKEVTDYANKRVESLLGVENGGDNSIDSPLVSSSLDDTTVGLIMAVLTMATTRKEAMELFRRRIKDRAKLLADNEAGRAYNAAVDIVSKKNNNIGWEWLLSRSIDKREIHFVLVGMTARYGQRINGETPGERINCKCGKKLIKLV